MASGRQAGRAVPYAWGLLLRASWSHQRCIAWKAAKVAVSLVELDSGAQHPDAGPENGPQACHFAALRYGRASIEARQLS